MRENMIARPHYHSRLASAAALGMAAAVLQLSALAQDADDAPGKKHKVDIASLPEPFATESVRNHSEVVDRPDGAELQVPDGFSVAKFADGFEHPRYLCTAPNGDIFVTESNPGKILVLRDKDGDGQPETKEEFAGGLNKPFGLAFYPPGKDGATHLYVAETDGIVRFAYSDGDLQATGEAEPVAKFDGGGHLEGGGHWTRDIAFSADGEDLYAAVGSKTNVNEEGLDIEDERARIFVMGPDGSNKRPYATGIRNPVGIAVHPDTGDLWTSVNERDGLGHDLVPDYITRVKEGGFYGWPWYYMGGHPDPHHKDNPHEELADKVLDPDIPVVSHSATLNMVIYTGDQFPDEYRGDAFAAFHGSWNREPRTGYKVVRVDLQDGVPAEAGVYEDFLTGFLLPDGTVWGRPVGLTVAADGALLMSEDGNNTIWRIAHDG
ncbi:sorbosone dehydrogenase family protein [soil metagenome]